MWCIVRFWRGEGVVWVQWRRQGDLHNKCTVPAEFIHYVLRRLAPKNSSIVTQMESLDHQHALNMTVNDAALGCQYAIILFWLHVINSPLPLFILKIGNNHYYQILIDLVKLYFHTHFFFTVLWFGAIFFNEFYFLLLQKNADGCFDF